MTDTLNAVDQAIQRHIGEITQGGFAEAWVIVVHTQTLDGDGISGYRILTSDTQPLHVDSGLMDIGQSIIQASFDASMSGDNDD